MKRIFNKQPDIDFRIRKHGFGFKIVLGFFLIFSVSACEDYLEIDSPQSQVVGELVFEEKNLANAAMSGVYISLRERIFYAYYYAKNLGLYSDELVKNGYPDPYTDVYFYNNILPITPYIEFWADGYSVIYKLNSILEGIENSKGLPIEFKNQIKGEAMFIRAFLHFNLMNLYGDIPYITTTDYNMNKSVTRMPTQEVYDAIYADLTQAKELLTDAYPSGERIRVNKSVVSALLARVYLYDEMWEEAEAESTLVISNGTYTMETDLSKLFLKESTSTLWQLQSYPTLNASEAGTFYIDPEYIEYKSFFLSDQVMNSFESGDQRKTSWIASGLKDGEQVYMSYKYKETWVSQPDSKEHSIVMRVEEQYLIRAEARAHLGNISGAQQDLNTIRNRAGLGDTAAGTLPDLLEAILQERNVELFTEMSHRWFDLKRMGLADEILGPIKSGWDSKDILFPIPEEEILSNPNLLPQNPGYN